MTRTSTLLIVAVATSLAACGTSSDDNLDLAERYYVPLDGSRDGIRSAASVTVQSDSLTILDPLSGRLFRLDPNGAVITSRRLRPLADGSTGRNLAALPNGGHLVLSGVSSACAVYDTALNLLSSCSLPGDFLHIAHSFFVGDALVVTGTLTGSTHPIHIFTEQLEPVVSFGEARTITDDSFASRLKWGIGVAAPGPHNTILYAAYNPFDLRIYDLKGVELKRVGRKEWMARAEDVGIAVDGDSSTSVLYDIFPRTVGLVAVNAGILHVRYDPEVDRTTLVLIDHDGRRMSEAEVPFFMRLVSRSPTHGLDFVRDIDGRELIRYRIE